MLKVYKDLMGDKRSGAKPFMLKTGDRFTIDGHPEAGVLTKLEYGNDSHSLDVWALQEPFKLIRLTGTLNVTEV